jgi:hypothetical protein
MGGTDELENGQTLCVTCNNIKRRNRFHSHASQAQDDSQNGIAINDGQKPYRLR